MKLVLASSSPRRAELLRAAGIAFEMEAAGVPEVRGAGEPPVEFARRVALEKARAVAARRPEALVLGADTIVCLGDEVLGKPRDARDAARMLGALSGQVHEVTTAVALVGPGASHGHPQGLKPPISGGADGAVETAPLRKPPAAVEHETTRVWMCEVSEEEIDAYIATDEPMDKAGAYAIQGMASRWVTRIEGDYPTVMGLQTALVWRMLREKGYA